LGSGLSSKDPAGNWLAELLAGLVVLLLVVLLHLVQKLISDASTAGVVNHCRPDRGRWPEPNL